MRIYVNPVRLIVIFLLLGMTSPAHAEKDEHQQHHEAMREIAGPNGPYTVTEHFPADYFLVHTNLPHAIGLALSHPRKAELKLNGQQEQAIKNMQQKITPTVTRLASSIKQAELKLAQQLMQTAAPLEELYPLVDAIAAQRVELTKAHLACIREVRAALRPEQFTAMLAYAAIPEHE